MTTKMVATASEYVRLRKSVRSIIGSGMWRSHRTKAMSVPTARAKRTRISAESQPARGPSITAPANEPIATANSS